VKSMREAILVVTRRYDTFFNWFDFECGFDYNCHKFFFLFVVPYLFQAFMSDQIYW